MSEFYLQTLEGARYLGEVSQARRELVRDAFDYFYNGFFSNVTDPVERFYKTFDKLTIAYTDAEIKTLYDRPDLKPEARKAADLFEVNRSRQRQAQAAQEAASAQEAARVSALQQQQELEDAQAEAEAEREERDAQRRAEALQRAQEEADAQAAALEAETIINEDNGMAQNIPAQDETDVNISTQLVTSGQEYTVVDETAETIAYVDEAGELHVEQKQKSGLGWIWAAAAAILLLT